MKYKAQVNVEDELLIITISHKFLKGESRLAAITRDHRTIEIGDIRVQKNILA